MPENDLARFSDQRFHEMASEILEKCFECWPDYDFALLDNVNNIEKMTLNAHSTGEFLVHVLRRIQAFVDFLQVTTGEPTHLWEIAYEGDNLSRLARALAETTLLECPFGGVMIDRDTFLTRLRLIGFNWNGDLASN